MNKLILVLIFTLTLCATALAQSNFTDDTFVITTYYPAPYGVYRNMRLNPSDEPTAGVGPGVMYYNQTEDMMKFYNGSTWLNMTAGGAGGGYWTQSDSDINNANNGNVVVTGSMQNLSPILYLKVPKTLDYATSLNQRFAYNSILFRRETNYFGDPAVNTAEIQSPFQSQTSYAHYPDPVGGAAGAPSGMLPGIRFLADRNIVYGGGILSVAGIGVGVGRDNPTHRLEIAGSSAIGSVTYPVGQVPCQLLIAGIDHYNQNPVAAIGFRTNTGIHPALGWEVETDLGAITVGKSNTNNLDVSGYMAFSTRNNNANPYVNPPQERMRITADGNVGIGTTSPAQKLSVNGTIESTSGGVKFPDGTVQTTKYTMANCERASCVIVGNNPSSCSVNCSGKYPVSSWVDCSGVVHVLTANGVSCSSGWNGCNCYVLCCP